jgi:RNA-directed DNA polymerase
MLADTMSSELSVSVDFIRSMGKSASHRYKTFFIAKRNGGYREIHHPAKELKALQRWIAFNIANRFEVHHCATAYIKGASVRDNASRHQRSRYLLRMDFASFFESISDMDVIEHCRHYRSMLPEGWGDDDSGLLAALCCRNGRLTIGAPSSPALSNALCLDLDRALDAIAVSAGVCYSRYADDLFFSSARQGALGEVERQVHAAVAACVHPRALHVNAKKTIHSSRKHRRRVTGLVLTSDGGLSLGWDKKRWIRSQIHRANALTDAEWERLRGWLGQVKSVEPDFLTRLEDRYGAALIADIRRGKRLAGPPSTSATKASGG